MKNVLDWKTKNEFVIDDASFVIDLSTGYNNRRLSMNNSFTIVKTLDFLNVYCDVASNYSGLNNILELGIFQGGGFVFFDKIFNPRVLHGIEISNKVLEPVDKYIAGSDANLKIHYGVSQDNESYINSIINDAFEGVLDLVIDDASHTYELTRKSFEILFPLLKPGGLYIIEDWAWAYAKTFEDPHPWSTETSLVKLILEMIHNVGSNNWAIESIQVYQPMVIIKKSEKFNTMPNLDYKFRGLTDNILI